MEKQKLTGYNTLATTSSFGPEPEHYSRLKLSDGFMAVLVGVIPMLILVALIGLLPVEFAFKHEGNTFGNVFGGMAFLLPASLVFIMIAFFIRDSLFALYPLIIWLLTSSVANLGLFHFIANSIPEISTESGRAVYFFAVMFWYLSAYLLLRPVSFMYKALKYSPGKRKNHLSVYGTVLGVNLLLVIGLSQAGNLLHLNQQHERLGIRVPSNAAMISNLPQPVADDIYEYKVANSKSTVQKNGEYQLSYPVRVSPVSKWWKRDTEQNCGQTTTLSRTAGISAEYEYKETPGGVRYARAVHEENTTPPKAENAYQRHVYCWVNDYQKYKIDFSDQSNNNQLEKFPIETVIDNISTANRYMPDCWYGKYQTQDFLPAAYCSDQDIDNLKQLDSIFSEKYTNSATIIEQFKRQAAAEANKPKDFDAVGELNITEWGISIPLSKETKDAYYLLDPFKVDTIRIGLRSFDSEWCMAGGHNFSSGLARMSRNSIDHVNEMYKDSFFSAEDYGLRKLGNHYYNLSLSPSINCAAELSIEQKTNLREQFDWSRRHIKQL